MPDITKQDEIMERLSKLEEALAKSRPASYAPPAKPAINQGKPAGSAKPLPRLTTDELSALGSYQSALTALESALEHMKTVAATLERHGTKGDRQLAGRTAANLCKLLGRVGAGRDQARSGVERALKEKP